MKTLLLSVALALVGCATNPGVAPASDGTLTAMRRGTSFWASIGPLRLQALKDADDYCAARGMRANVIRSRELPAIRQWPEAQVSFTCE